MQPSPLDHVDPTPRGRAALGALLVPGTLSLAILVAGCVTPTHADPLPFDLELEEEVAEHCRRLHAAGLFRPDTLAGLPEARREVERVLCSVSPGRCWLPFAAGFGVGPMDLPHELPAPLAPLYWRQPVDEELWRGWRAEHCADAESTIDLEADWKVAHQQPAASRVAGEMQAILRRTLDAFAPARAALPADRTRDWEHCARTYEPWVAETPGVLCRLVATRSPPNGETLYFTAQRILPPELVGPLLLPIPRPRYFAPKLRRDLEVEGASCEGLESWRAGRRVKGVHTLRCRRDGEAAVTFRLETSKGTCLESLPRQQPREDDPASTGNPTESLPLPFRGLSGGAGGSSRSSRSRCIRDRRRHISLLLP